MLYSYLHFSENFSEWTLYQVYYISDPRAIPKHARLDFQPVGIPFGLSTRGIWILPDWTFYHEIHIQAHKKHESLRLQTLWILLQATIHNNANIVTSHSWIAIWVNMKHIRNISVPPILTWEIFWIIQKFDDMRFLFRYKCSNNRSSLCEIFALSHYLLHIWRTLLTCLHVKWSDINRLVQDDLTKSIPNIELYWQVK